MIYFICGAFFGVLVMLAARIADINIERAVERYKKTGTIAKSKPIIVDGENKVQKFIDETFEPVKETDEHDYSL